MLKLTFSHHLELTGGLGIGDWRLGTGDWELVTHYSLLITNYQLPMIQLLVQVSK